MAELAGGLTAGVVQAQLRKILASPAFLHAERMSRFLRFTVERVLASRGDEIKEYLLGVEVFDKEASYDPRIDPTVRVEARRLRSKIHQYYQTDGRDDAVSIDIPKGSYVPVFGRRDSQPAAAPPAAPERLSIAVLPFVNRSLDPEDEYFSDGLTDELIHALTRVEGLRVVARTSAFQFKGQAQDIRRIGEQLQVAAVLEGAVRRAGQRLRITAQLVNVADGYQLWSQVFEREMRDVFAIQDEISRAIVDTLRLGLSGRGPLTRPGGDLEAYHQYLKACFHANRRTADGLAKSLELFEQAVARDPGYAPAHAGLASAWSLLAAYGIRPPGEVIPQAKAAALRAIELDERLAEARCCLAYVATIYEWRWEEAERHYRRALELNPGYAQARHWYGYDCLGALGRLDEAQDQLEQAQRLDPLSLIIGTSLGGIFLMRREYDLAIAQYNKVLALEPNFYKGWTGLGRAWFQKGEYDQAIAHFEKGRDLSGGALYIAGGLGQSYAAAGRRPQVRKLLDELTEQATRVYVQSTAFALIYAGLDEPDRAFACLEKAYAERESSLVFLNSYPAYDRLRDDPRFTSLVRRLGLGR